MSVYNPAYNPTSYLTNIYGRLVPENPYAPFYPDHQGIPPGWRCPPAFSTNGNNSCMNLGGYSAAPSNPAYLLPAHYYTYPVPAAAPAPPEHIDNYFPPCLLFPAQVPPSFKQQRVKAYIQQCNKVLHFLCFSSVEFARHAHTLLVNLGYSNTPATPEVWADQLLNFHECYLQGNLLETMQGTLGIDANVPKPLRTCSDCPPSYPLQVPPLRANPRCLVISVGHYVHLIKNVLHLTPKQTTYNGYKALVIQINQCDWEDQSKNMAPWTSWNTSSNTNWQTRATNGIWSLIPTNPANPALCFPPGWGTTSANKLPEQYPPAQLNAADLHEASKPLNANPNDYNNIPDSANNQEVLCTNKIWDSLWINIPEETQEK
ncbi:hypothetical protein E4T56_gene3660 [Termitomyces sp. T112]|nr:hypothetical protein E4T56_gene3660 [Termitomyces sp. T112]